MPSYSPDFWEHLKQYTSARIALGHTGNSVPTDQLLAFQLAHAQARDAVHMPLSVNSIVHQLADYQLPLLTLHSQATDRRTYLQRPDLGRRLTEASKKPLEEFSQHTFQLCFVIADGLSALAIEKNIRPLLDELLPLVQAARYSLAPLCIVEQGRVALGDEVASLLHSQMVVMFIGERPGLSSPDSLGIYLTYMPQVGLTDERRNCISNVRPGGLPYAFAAQKLFYLITQSFRRQLSGVALKDDMQVQWLE